MPDRAEFRAATVPRSMEVGREYQVSVIMRNQGDTTWTRRAGYQLAVTNPRYTKRWRTRVVKLSSNDSIKPERQKIFKFKVRAPKRAGQYDFQWQMKRNRSWFPQASGNVSINVTRR